MIYTCTINTPLGAMTAAAQNQSLTGLWFVGQKYYPPETGQWEEKPDYPVFEALCLFLSSLFFGQGDQGRYTVCPKRDTLPKGRMGYPDEDPLRKYQNIR